MFRQCIQCRRAGKESISTAVVFHQLGWNVLDRFRLHLGSQSVFGAVHIHGLCETQEEKKV